MEGVGWKNYKFGFKMSGVKARNWLKITEFEGLPKRDDFQIIEEELPPLKDGG